MVSRDGKKENENLRIKSTGDSSRQYYTLIFIDNSPTLPTYYLQLTTYYLKLILILLRQQHPLRPFIDAGAAASFVEK